MADAPRPELRDAAASGADVDVRGHEQITTPISVLRAAVVGGHIAEVSGDVQWAISGPQIATEPIAHTWPEVDGKSGAVPLRGGLDQPILEATLEPAGRGSAGAAQTEFLR